MDKSNLKIKYETEIVKEMMKVYGLTNALQVPKITKIVLNSGLGEAKNNPQVIDDMKEELSLIAGQQPVVTKSKKAISNFKIRENMPIGVKVTLRKERMWYFLDKLINVVLPQVKDFRGVETKNFDGKGNYALGLKDHTVFPEIDSNKMVKIKPFQIIINTNAGVDEMAFNLLKLLGVPFRK